MNKNLIEKIAPQLTELMIKKMETLTEEWRKPWIADLAHGLPRNLRGTPYRGGNILMLLFLSEIAGYRTPLFMTFKQAKEEGLNILKGSGSFPVFFWKLYKWVFASSMRKSGSPRREEMANALLFPGMPMSRR